MTRTRKHAPATRTRLTTSALLLAPLALGWSGGSQAELSQRPLLVTSTGAKPNIVVSLDNSGSMAFPYPDGYVMRAPGDRSDTTQLTGFATFAAQRSAAVNSMYYNPRVTYEPRVDADDKVLPSDGLAFVSNASSAKMWHSVYAKSEDEARAGASVLTTDANFKRYGEPAQPDAPYKYIWFLSVFTPEWLPVNVAYTTEQAKGLSPKPTFTYFNCSGKEATTVGKADVTLCTDAAPTPVVVTFESTDKIALPKGNARNECKEDKDQKQEASHCTTEQEVANILNWYRYYRNRMEATKTALGQALQSDKLDGAAARIGYRNINMGGIAAKDLPHLGVQTKRPQSLRGVRPWTGDDKKQFFNWLYGTYPGGGTPMRTAYGDIANYFQVTEAGAENPWAQDPSRPANNSSDAPLRNPELSCRRSFQVALSDGAWNDDNLQGTLPGENNEDNTTGTSHDRLAPFAPLGPRFAYSPAGQKTGRDRYIAYPGKAKGGLADLAALYYWHKDLREDLPNNVPTQFLYPPFWQHLRTYTIGYMIRPSGENGKADGLSFRQIDDYRNQYFSNSAAAPTAPSWPSSGPDLSSTAANSDSSSWQFVRPESDRIDDFIQSGYTGGGRSFSVTDAGGIRKAVDAILADILDASGDDAGVAAGKQADASEPLNNRLKFKVNYRTTDQVGDVIAEKLDRLGTPIELDADVNGTTLSPRSTTYWSADTQMAEPGKRHLYTLGSDGVGVELNGALKDLPTSVQNALRVGPYAPALPTDKRFIDYLRGADPVTDTQGQVYRMRASRIGAIVNSAPILLGSAVNQRYQSKTSTVTGKENYAAFRAGIAGSSETLLAATNAGVVHALQAANGKELAAYMPRRSMTALLDQAQAGSPFRYVLDGPLSTNDIYQNLSWNLVVVGSGGRGERVVYALRPKFAANGEVQFGRDDYLWETGPDLIDNAELSSGHMSNPARSGQTASGDWVVVLNSGHDNPVGDGRGHGLVVLNAMTGAVLRTIPLPEGFRAGNTQRNGLGGVTLVRNAGLRIVAAYAGDARGQLWRFDLSGPPLSWRVSYNKPLFQTANARPIYAAPAWQAHPKGGRIVVAATGMLLHDGDTADVGQREAIYGIWDPTSSVDEQEASNFETVKPETLLEQKVEEFAKTETVAEIKYFSTTRNRIDWAGGHRGWKLELGGWTTPATKDNPEAQKPPEMSRPGERVIDQIQNFSTSVLINAVVVNAGMGTGETCTRAAPPSVTYVLNALDGSGKPAFDTDQDNKLEPYSMAYVASGGFARGSVTIETPMSTKRPSGQQGTGSGEGSGVSSGATSQGESTESQGEGATTNDGTLSGLCAGSSSRRATAMGTSGKSLLFGTDCRTWSRQQYQLTLLPK